MAKIEVKGTDITIISVNNNYFSLTGVDIRTISEHLKNIFKSSELDDKAVIRKFRTTAEDGKIISVPRPSMGNTYLSNSRNPAASNRIFKSP